MWQVDSVVIVWKHVSGGEKNAGNVNKQSTDTFGTTDFKH